MDVVRKRSELPRRWEIDQQAHFKGRKVPEEFGLHGRNVAHATAEVMLSQQKRLGLTDENMDSLLMLSLYHPLRDLTGVSPRIIKRISESFQRFHRYRLLDEQPLPKDLKEYRKMMFLPDGRLDPVFLVRAIDMGESHAFDLQKEVRLYREVYGVNKTIDEIAEMRTSLLIAMLEVYYPVADNLHFINSDSIKDTAVKGLWPKEYAALQLQMREQRQRLKNAQLELVVILEKAIEATLAKQPQTRIINNSEGGSIYLTRIKDEGSMILKALRRNWPFRLDAFNDTVGFLVLVAKERHTLKFATQLLNELKHIISTRIGFDPKCLMCSESERTRPSVHLDLIHPIEAWTEDNGSTLVSPFGAEVQIMDIDGATTCTQGALIHGASKQFAFFDSELLIDTAMLQHLVNYLDTIYREIRVLNEFMPPDLNTEHDIIRCTIIRERKKGNGIQHMEKEEKEIHLKEGAVLLDLLAHLNLLQYEISAVDKKTGRLLRYGEPLLDTTDITIMVQLDRPGIDYNAARFWVTNATDPLAIDALKAIGKHNRRAKSH